MAANVNYRHEARAHLKRAKELLATDEDEDVEHAALKLRKVMEAVTYERAKGMPTNLARSR